MTEDRTDNAVEDLDGDDRVGTASAVGPDATITEPEDTPDSVKAGGVDLLGADQDLMAVLEEEGLEFERTAEPGSALENYIAAAVPIVIGIFGLIVSLQIPFGHLRNPGPGLWPTVLSAAMLIGGILVAVQAARGMRDTEKFTRGARFVFLGAVSLVPYGLFIETIGFEIPTLIAALVWLRFIGRESWLRTIVTGVGAVVAVYLIFIVALRVTIPHWIAI